MLSKFVSCRGLCAIALVTLLSPSLVHRVSGLYIPESDLGHGVLGFLRTLESTIEKKTAWFYRHFGQNVDPSKIDKVRLCDYGDSSTSKFCSPAFDRLSPSQNPNLPDGVTAKNNPLAKKKNRSSFSSIPSKCLEDPDGLGCHDLRTLLNAPVIKDPIIPSIGSDVWTKHAKKNDDAGITVSCEDSNESFVDNEKKKVTCQDIAALTDKKKAKKCRKKSVKEACPETCYMDSTESFVDNEGKDVECKDIAALTDRKKGKKCNKPSVQEACPVTCNVDLCELVPVESPDNYEMITSSPTPPVGGITTLRPTWGVCYGNHDSDKDTADRKNLMRNVRGKWCESTMPSVSLEPSEAPVAARKGNRESEFRSQRPTPKDAAVTSKRVVNARTGVTVKSVTVSTDTPFGATGDKFKDKDATSDPSVEPSDRPIIIPPSGEPIGEKPVQEPIVVKSVESFQPIGEKPVPTDSFQPVAPVAPSFTPVAPVGPPTDPPQIPIFIPPSGEPVAPPTVYTSEPTTEDESTLVPTLVPTSTTTIPPTSPPSSATTIPPTSPPSSATTATTTVTATDACINNPDLFLDNKGELITCAEVAALKDKKKERKCGKPVVLENCREVCDPDCNESVPTLPPTSEPTPLPSSETTTVSSSVTSTLTTTQPSSSTTTVVPTMLPTDSGTTLPPTTPPTTDTPSDFPSMTPSASPSGNPSGKPSAPPSSSPSGTPSDNPSGTPSGTPSANPSGSPSAVPSAVPSDEPSGEPSKSPSRNPSGEPSASPSDTPSTVPSGVPSDVPSGTPTLLHSVPPSQQPSGSPSDVPSGVPSLGPTGSFFPSTPPSDTPTVSAVPSGVPSAVPSASPSDVPSGTPSSNPSADPSSTPSGAPSGVPSGSPSGVPSADPSASPSGVPSGVPSALPSGVPSGLPSSLPSSRPSSKPSSIPSSVPSGLPSYVCEASFISFNADGSGVATALQVCSEEDQNMLLPFDDSNGNSLTLLNGLDDVGNISIGSTCTSFDSSELLITLNLYSGFTITGDSTVSLLAPSLSVLAETSAVTLYSDNTGFITSIPLSVEGAMLFELVTEVNGEIVTFSPTNNTPDFCFECGQSALYWADPEGYLEYGFTVNAYADEDAYINKKNMTRYMHTDLHSLYEDYDPNFVSDEVDTCLIIQENNTETPYSYSGGGNITFNFTEPDEFFEFKLFNIQGGATLFVFSNDGVTTIAVDEAINEVQNIRVTVPETEMVTIQFDGQGAVCGIKSCITSTRPASSPHNDPPIGTSSPTVSAVPSIAPSDVPSGSPSGTPSADPSGSPSGTPSAVPSGSPSAVPSGTPSAVPSGTPSGDPSGSPSAVPSGIPSGSPSDVPSGSPSAVPSGIPSGSPSDVPSGVPSQPPSGSFFPSTPPSDTPTVSAVPSGAPSADPSASPSDVPSGTPSAVPSGTPSGDPSSSPSAVPSGIPSGSPSDAPSGTPSAVPSGIPSGSPSDVPSVSPSAVPSGIPSSSPSDVPSGVPSQPPSGSFFPSTPPSDTPSVSSYPSLEPSASPSGSPTSVPSSQPTDCYEQYDITAEDIIYQEGSDDPIPEDAVQIINGEVTNVTIEISQLWSEDTNLTVFIHYHTETHDTVCEAIPDFAYEDKIEKDLQCYMGYTDIGIFIYFDDELTLEECEECKPPGPDDENTIAYFFELPCEPICESLAPSRAPIISPPPSPVPSSQPTDCYQNFAIKEEDLISHIGSDEPIPEDAIKIINGENANVTIEITQLWSVDTQISFFIHYHSETHDTVCEGVPDFFYEDTIEKELQCYDGYTDLGIFVYLDDKLSLDECDECTKPDSEDEDVVAYYFELSCEPICESLAPSKAPALGPSDPPVTPAPTRAPSTVPPTDCYDAYGIKEEDIEDTFGSDEPFPEGAVIITNGDDGNVTIEITQLWSNTELSFFIQYHTMEGGSVCEGIPDFSYEMTIEKDLECFDGWTDIGIFIYLDDQLTIEQCDGCKQPNEEDENVVAYYFELPCKPICETIAPSKAPVTTDAPTPSSTDCYDKYGIAEDDLIGNFGSEGPIPEDAIKIINGENTNVTIKISQLWSQDTDVTVFVHYHSESQASVCEGIPDFSYEDTIEKDLECYDGYTDFGIFIYFDESNLEECKQCTKPDDEDENVIAYYFELPCQPICESLEPTEAPVTFTVGSTDPEEPECHDGILVMQKDTGGDPICEYSSEPFMIEELGEPGANEVRFSFTNNWDSTLDIDLFYDRGDGLGQQCQSLTSLERGSMYPNTLAVACDPITQTADVEVYISDSSISYGSSLNRCGTEEIGSCSFVYKIPCSVDASCDDQARRLENNEANLDSDESEDTPYCVHEDFPCEGDEENMVYVCHYSSRAGYQTFCIPEMDSDILRFNKNHHCGPCDGWNGVEHAGRVN